MQNAMGKNAMGKKQMTIVWKKTKDVIQTTQNGARLNLPQHPSKLVNSEDLDFEVDVRG